MAGRRKLVIAVLGFMALFALIGTWSQNLFYFAGGAGPAAFAAFVEGVKVTPASRSIGIDISVVFYAASLFMVLEARKLGIRYVWAYVIFGLLIAVSFTFPLFLIAREIRLEKMASNERREAPLLGIGDVVGLAVLALVAVALSVYVIS